MRKSILLLLLFVFNSCATTENVIEYGSNEAAGAYKEINGVKIYYEIYGQGEPVLLLHGGTCHISYHSPLIELLAKNYRVIAVDSRGHGRSTLGERKMTYPLLANDMAKLVEQIGCGPVTVIGHSDGGIVSYIMAAKYPDKVKAFVPTGAYFRQTGRGGPTQEAIDWMRNLTPEKVANWGKGRPHGPAKENYLKLNPAPDWDHFITKSKNELWFSETGLDEDDLRNIRCPVLISHGEEERFVKLEDVIYTWQLIENADIYIAPNGNHRHHVDQIDAFGPILLRFLNKVYGH